MSRLVFRLVMSLASTRPGAWFFITIAPHVDRFLMRVSGGRFNTASGPLLFLRDAGRYMVIAFRVGIRTIPTGTSTFARCRR